MVFLNRPDSENKNSTPHDLKSSAQLWFAKCSNKKIEGILAAVIRLKTICGAYRKPVFPAVEPPNPSTISNLLFCTILCGFSSRILPFTHRQTKKHENRDLRLRLRRAISLQNLPDCCAHSTAGTTSRERVFHHSKLSSRCK